MDVPVGGAPMSERLRTQLDWQLDLFAPQTIRWFWISTPDTTAAPWCSAVDWANSE